jgi:hypothetical protein
MFGCGGTVDGLNGNSSPSLKNFIADGGCNSVDAASDPH